MLHVAHDLDLVSLWKLDTYTICCDITFLVTLGPYVIDIVSFFHIYVFLYDFVIQICSGITRGRVLSGEFYAQRLQKIYLHLSTDCFVKISL